MTNMFDQVDGTGSRASSNSEFGIRPAGLIGTNGTVLYASFLVRLDVISREYWGVEFRRDGDDNPYMVFRIECVAPSGWYTPPYQYGAAAQSRGEHEKHYKNHLRDFLRANRRRNIHLYPDDWKKLPIPVATAELQQPIIALVD